MRKTISTLLLGLSLAAIPACSGSGDVASETDKKKDEAFAAKVIDATWPVLVADDEVRQPFESHKMWAKLLNSRDYLTAVTTGKEVGGLPPRPRPRGRPGAADLRRHQRDHEGDHLAEPLRPSLRPRGRAGPTG